MSSITKPAWQGSPFPGLRGFTENESAIFFGREEEIAALLNRLKISRFIAIVGTSGCGKSSLIRAGLIPRLNNLTAGSDVKSLRVTPSEHGSNPFLSLAAKLEPILMDGRQLLAQDIAEMLYNLGNLGDLIKAWWAEACGSGHLFLFIDQFEELFTLAKPDYRQRFVVMLAKAVQTSHIRVILAVRAEFLNRCLDDPVLAKMMNQGFWALSPPNPDALREMIAQPALLSGLNIEEDLQAQILDDTRTGYDTLPLMAYVLELLHKVCKSTGKSPRKAYESFGCGRNAIGRHAQEAFDLLPPSEQDAFEEVIPKLVTVDQDRGLASRKYANLHQIQFSESAKNFIEVFVGLGLFLKRRTTNNAIVVEIAHESLLSQWPLIDNWVRLRIHDSFPPQKIQHHPSESARIKPADSRSVPHGRIYNRTFESNQWRTDSQNHERDSGRTEVEDLIDALENPELSHKDRERIGIRLAKIGDPRKGVGIDHQGLPEFAWCLVPAGEITLEHYSGKFTVNPFYISKYPTTWAQYQSFVDSDEGYRDKRWWKNLHQEIQPGEQYRKVANHPAERVSWYDAMAYCRWLSAVLGFEIRLPTEWEWQQAATSGDTEHAFPWGRTFKKNCANTLESGLGKTTAVGMYPTGASTAGAMDMSGNIWEWCLNEYENPARTEPSDAAVRAVRGGAWDTDRNASQVSYRQFSPPDNRYDLLGFRLCSAFPNPELLSGLC